jgi:hypothetical protein
MTQSEKQPREIKKDDLEKYRHNGYYTVGRLLKCIQEKLDSGELEQDSLVLSQRIEDMYFEKNNWGVVKKEGEHYHHCLEHNKKIDEGFYLNKEEFPDIKGGEPFLNRISEEEMEASKDQYHPIWCPVVYKDDKNLYLDLHY